MGRHKKRPPGERTESGSQSPLFVWASFQRSKKIDKSDASKPDSSESDASESDACVLSHNKIRAKHQAKPLTRSDKLVSDAAVRADKLVAINQLKHLPGLNGYGENLYMSVNKPADCNEVTQSWYREFESFGYDFKHPQFNFETGHATQVIWASTKYLGCSTKKITAKGFMKQFTVCLYEPAGNVINQFPQNVKPSV
ncbi:cysteine-rich secretory protein-like protein [Sarcoptes scabiei]|uniref:Cysteine-rich secretory protein-like protein n=1 Tax=Sarcoptes scabiei TaxID=52283 RepID=A0A132A3N7_SARSC|nr:cysteine-rich secretory protein-like protein [Sarcoptes scabiei]